MPRVATPVDPAAVSAGIRAIYDCLFSQDAQTDALDVMRDAIGAEHVILMRMAGSGISRLGTCHRLSSIAQAQLESLEVSPENQLILGALTPSRALRSTDVVTRRQILRSAAYQQTLRPINGGLSAYAMVLDGSEQVLAVACRSAARGIDFDDPALSRMSFMLPHVASVSNLARQLLRERDVARMGLDALDMLTDGVVVLAANGQLLYVNSAADALLSQADRIRRSAVAIEAAEARDDRQLQLAIEQARALASAAPPGEALGRVGRPIQVLVGRRKSEWPLVVTLLPLRSTFAIDCEPRAVVLRIVDPAAAMAAVPELSLLRRLFDLTPKEAGLAAALASGLSLKQAAAQQGVQFSTARTHLEHIFQKTRTHQQTQLILLLKSVQPLASASALGPHRHFIA